MTATIASLASDSDAGDIRWLLQPVCWARARRVPEHDLVIVYVASDAEVRVMAVAPLV